MSAPTQFLPSNMNCLTITHVVRRLITSNGCPPWSRKLLRFGKWTDCHSIFCHWLSLITVFAVPSCLPRWIQQSTGPKPWVLWTLCAHDVSNDNSSWIGSDGYFKLAFFGLQYSRCFQLQYSAYSEHLYMKVPAGYYNDWGTAFLCKSSHQLV